MDGWSKGGKEVVDFDKYEVRKLNEKTNTIQYKHKYKYKSKKGREKVVDFDNSEARKLTVLQLEGLMINVMVKELTTV